MSRLFCSLLTLLLLSLFALPGHADHSALRNDTFNTLPDSHAGSFRTDGQRFWDHEAAQRDERHFFAFIYSGGLHVASGACAGGICTSPAFSTEAFVPERVNQSPTAIAYSAIGTGDVCWVIISSDNNGITGWTRVGTTAYYYQCEGDTTPNEPSLPPNSASLMRVSISANAITSVRDMRNRSPFFSTVDIAMLPTPGVVGRGIRVRDSIRGLWMDEGSQWFSLSGRTVNVEEFGASPTATAAVNSTAIQAAIDAVASTGGRILVPQRYATNVALATPNVHIEFVGLGPETSAIINATSDVFSLGSHILPNNLVIRDMTLESGTGGGHIFVVAGSNQIGGMVLSNLYLLQRNDARSVWFHNTSGTYIDNLVQQVWSQHTLTATVPTWNFPTDGGNVNTNTWFRCRFTNTGNYAVLIGNNNSAVNFQYQNTFRDINFEDPRGGAISLTSANGAILEGIGVYDLLGVTTRTLFRFLTGGVSGNTPRNITLRNIQRIGGTLGVGLFDVHIDNNPVNAAISISNVRNDGGSAFAVDLGDNIVFIVNSSMTINNGNRSVNYTGDSLSVGNMMPFTFDSLTPAQITGVVIDYNPGLGGYWRLSSDASRNISGIAGGVNGRHLYIYNAGEFDILLLNDDGSSAAANRIITLAGGNLTITPNHWVQLIYDATTPRWRVVNYY